MDPVGLFEPVWSTPPFDAITEPNWVAARDADTTPTPGTGYAPGRDPNSSAALAAAWIAAQGHKGDE